MLLNFMIIVEKISEKVIIMSLIKKFSYLKIFYLSLIFDADDKNKFFIEILTRDKSPRTND